MRLDRLTTKFQQALADAQSLAVGADNPFIEPVHVLAALLDQEDGGTASLASRAGVNVPKLRESLRKAIDRLPKVEGHGGEVQIGRDLSNLLNLTDKEAQKRGDQYIASELFLLAVVYQVIELNVGASQPPRIGTGSLFVLGAYVLVVLLLAGSLAVRFRRAPPGHQS